MERVMRRFRQALPQAECEEMLRRGTSGVLSLHGMDGYPYGVPLSYAYVDEKIVFHCAKEGYKLNCIRQDCRASFCVIDMDDVIPERFTTQFRSVMAFGRVREVTEPEEVLALAIALGRRYGSGTDAELRDKVSEAMPRLGLLVMDVECLTGKEAKELMEQRMDKS